MKKSSKYLKKNDSGKNSKLVLILGIVAAVLVVGIILLLALIPKGEHPVETQPATTVPTTAVEETTVPVTEVPETTVPETTVYKDPDMLADMAALYEQNPDFFGWLTIEGTKVDYPVMYTPNEPDKYLYKNFEGKMDLNGSLYIEENTLFDPESENIIIYGHNMMDGSMFENIMKYRDEEFSKAHPIIKYTTLYEEREYEVMAAFYDKVYGYKEDVFKFYRFIEVKDEETFNEGYNYFKEHAEVDTGVTAEFGDRFIMLVTCSTHHPDGRFVVVGKLIQPSESES